VKNRGSCELFVAELMLLVLETSQIAFEYFGRVDDGNCRKKGCFAMWLSAEMCQDALWRPLCMQKEESHLSLNINYDDFSFTLLCIYLCLAERSILETATSRYCGPMDRELYMSP
jgi:hypothetical protein